MINAFTTMEDTLKEERVIDFSPELRERAQQLTDVIEALQKIESSVYWKVLQKYVFEVDLDKAKRRLAKEKDTIEMFRLQGEIRWGEKFHLASLNEKYRNELQAIKQKLNA